MEWNKRSGALPSTPSNRRLLFAVALQSQLIIIAGPGMLDRCTSKVNVMPQTLFLPTDDVIMKKWRQEMGLAPQDYISDPWGQGGSVKVTCVRKMADAAALYCVFYLY